MELKKLRGAALAIVSGAFLIIVSAMSFRVLTRSEVSQTVDEARADGLLVRQYVPERTDLRSGGGGIGAITVWLERRAKWDRQGLFARRIPQEGFVLVARFSRKLEKAVFLKVQGSKEYFGMLDGGHWHYQDYDIEPDPSLNLVCGYYDEPEPSVLFSLRVREKNHAAEIDAPASKPTR